MYTYRDIVKVLSSHASNIMVDKILLFEESQYILAIKNVSLSDIGFSSDKLLLSSAPFFILIESMSQLLTLFIELSRIEKVLYDFQMGSLDPNILPGDTLSLELKVIQNTKSQMKIQGRILRDGNTVFSPTITLQQGRDK